MNLWLDDIRDPARYGCIGWTWVTNADDAIKLLASGVVECASLDHDLSVDATMGTPQVGEKTGYTVVCWMEENGMWPPKGVRVHSQNPVGKIKMQAVIDRHYSAVDRHTRCSFAAVDEQRQKL